MINMAAVVKGLAIVWACGGLSFTAGVVSATNDAKFQSAELDRGSDKGEVKDGNGECVSQVFYNKKKTLRCTVVPCHASVAATAATSGDAWTLAAGTTMTFVDANGTILDGSYNLISAKQRRANSEAMMVDLEMELYEANDVTTATT